MRQVGQRIDIEIRKSSTTPNQLSVSLSVDENAIVHTDATVHSEDGRLSIIPALHALIAKLESDGRAYVANDWTTKFRRS